MALSDDAVVLFVCSSVCSFVACEFVKSLATWQHLATSGGLLYRLQYTCFMTVLMSPVAARSTDHASVLWVMDVNCLWPD